MKPIKDILISQIIPGKNDRTVFDENGLRELADNIKEHGLIQPITVRHAKYGKHFEIIAGESRLRACKLLGWKTIPAIVTDLKDEDASAITLAENIARKSLDPIDEACAYQSRIESFGWSIEDLSKYAGTSTIHIQFRLKLLKLIPEIQKLIRGGNIQTGYAQVLADANLDSNSTGLNRAGKREAPRIVIEMEGGLIHDITANVKSQVLVLDADTEAGDADRIKEITKWDGDREEVYSKGIEEVEILPEYVDFYFSQFTQKE